MSAIFGLLNVSDTEEAFLNNIGQELVFAKINEALGYHQADVMKATSVFVKGNTELIQQRWLAPGSGYLTPVGQDPEAPGPAIQREGAWDVAYQLTEYSESLSYTRIALARMTVKELDAQLDAIFERSLARHRERMLIALMENTNLVWTDIVHGALTIRRLANTDGSLYPPIPGAVVDADDLHYLDPAYNVAGIADATNPVVDTRDEIIEHYGGRSSGGENILYIHGSDQTPWLAALTDYSPVEDFGKTYGAADTPMSKKLDSVPGRMHGRSNGCWLTEWAWMPDEYGMAVHLDFPPLMRRVDRADHRLPVGLSLVAKDRDHPLESAYYAERYGYGVGDRLAACCIEINAGAGVYTPPAAYTE